MSTEGTIKNWTNHCIKAICKRLDHLIAWPNANKRQQLQAELASRRPWAQCVGVMDGTVVPLAYQPSSADKGNFWNYKGFYGLAVFAVCKIHKNFRLIHLSFPGSPHDSRMFKDTLLYTDAECHFSSGEWVMLRLLSPNMLSGHTSCNRGRAFFQRKRQNSTFTLQGHGLPSSTALGN